MRTPELSAATWRKSTYSSNNANCVEVARIGQAVGVRDAKNVTGTTLAFSARPWSAFLTSLR